jgi:tRNA(Ile)-lysidine synthase
MIPDRGQVERFARHLDALIGSRARIGIAVSGGPDSLALLLLAAATRPRSIEAATVDHALRPGSADEARRVAELCARLAIPHRTLTADWPETPETALQERARVERYRLLLAWAKEHGLEAIATAHQLDDQVETLVMRLNRGSGVRGLAGMRPSGTVPGSRMPLLRPLLGWRRAELEAICAAAGITPAADPSNQDAHFERDRVRRGLSSADWLDPEGIAASAANLAHAHAALNWASAREWDHSVFESPEEILYRAKGAPSEIRRRIVARAVAHLATEGRGAELRGRELDRLLEVLAGGGQATIRGVRCAGGDDWRFARAPARRL